MFGLSVGVTMACVLAVYLGATVQASIGIGVGMIASPILAFADPAFIPATIMMSVLPLTFAVAWADRRHVERPGVGFAIIGRFVGVIAGALVVASISDEVVAVMVSMSVLFAVVVSLTSRRFQPTHRALVVAGVASGFTGTTTGVGGPPMALTYQHSDPATMRASLATFFSVGSMLSVGALAVAGQIGVRQLQLTSMLLPSVILGVITSRRYQDRLDPTLLRPIVLTVCTVAATALLVETF